MNRRVAAGLAVVAALLAPVQVFAGVVSKSIDILSIVPVVGVETAHVKSASVSKPGVVLISGLRIAPTLTYGAIAGTRLGPFGFGVLFQRTKGASSANDAVVVLTKAYGQFSVHLPYDDIVGILHFDFGWTYLDTQGTLTHGFGGKIGAALDYFPANWLSLGAGADLDLQAYKTKEELIGGYGGTLMGRIGFHL